MNKKSFIALCAVTAVAVVLAVAAVMSQPRLETSDQRGVPVFPTLVNDVDRLKTVVIRRDGETMSLDWDGKVWRYRERGNFPADAEKVTNLLLEMARLSKVEGKTRMPDRYDRLNVGDPVKGGTSTQIMLLDVEGKEIADVIVGKQQFSLGSKDGGTYVRLAGDPQVWLAQGTIIPGTQPGDWLKRDLVNIDAGAVKRVSVTHPNGGRVVVSKASPESAKFTIDNLPPGAQPASDFIADDYGRVLTGLTLENVGPAASIPFAKDKTTTAVVEGFDGFRVTLDMVEIEGETWVKIKGEPPVEAKSKEPTLGQAAPLDLRPDWAKLMGEINARAEGWAFQVPSFQVAPVKRSMAELLKKPAAKP